MGCGMFLQDFCNYLACDRPPNPYVKLLDFGTDNPEEVVRRAAGSLIHVKLNRPAYRALFAEGDEHYQDEMKFELPQPPEIYQWIATGKGRFGFHRPENLRYFAEPSMLTPRQRVPHECMGITTVTSAALKTNHVPARARFYKTRLLDQPNLISHWAVEYFDGKWVLKDPSIPDCEPHPDHLYSWQVYDSLFSADKDRLKQIFGHDGNDGQTIARPEVAAFKALAYDALTLMNGSFTPWWYNKFFGDVPLGNDAPQGPQARLFDVYGLELRNALESVDREDLIRDVRRFVEKHGIRLEPRIRIPPRLSSP